MTQEGLGALFLLAGAVLWLAGYYYRHRYQRFATFLKWSGGSFVLESLLLLMWLAWFN